jgi:predicted nucleotidyltransferase
MTDVVDQYLDAIRDLCREFGVTRLELFGSAATGEFDPERSDIDFLVEYPPDYDFGLWAARHFAFQERLADVLGRPVDLVMASALRNPRFIESINESRQLLYAA